MVLESLISVKVAEKKPVEMLPIAFIYSSIAVILSLWIFPSYASLTMVTFTVIACLPLMIQLIYIEKNKQEQNKRKLPIKIHQDTLMFFVFLFLGMALAFTLWFILLPIEVTNNAFFLQINTIAKINAPIATGSMISSGILAKILLNNLKLLGLCVLFSLFYGSGAIFILTWNASVTGVAIASSIRLAISTTGATGMAGIAGYLGVFTLSTLRYLLHGIPEILAYFLGGLAGGIISVAIIRHQFGTKKFLSSIYDSFGIIAAAVGLIVVAALIEIAISPIIPI